MRLLSSLKIATLLLLLLLAFSSNGQSQSRELGSQLPNLGDAGGGALSPAEEQQLAQKFMRAVRQSFTLLDDPLANSYLQDLADRLLSQLSGHNQDISVFIIDDPTINAFAGPGGHIGIHTGLILTARTEGELASVLAHEIAHVVQRHLMRRFETGKRQSLQNMGALIAAILLGGSNSQATEAILTSTVAGSIEQQLAYSRSHEQEADRIGLELLASADYDPRDMVSFFSILQKQQRIGQSKAPEFVRTHPLTTSRIADTTDRALRYPQQTYAQGPLYQVIQARIATFAKQDSTALSTFRKRIELSQTTHETRQYAQALTAMKKRHYNESRASLAPLLAANPLRLHYHYTAAEIELADNKAARAEEILQAILRLYPGNLSLTELYARTLLELNRPDEAYRLLKEALRHTGIQAPLYQLYAQTAIASGNSSEAYRSLAELEHSRGNTHQAIDYLEHALKDKTLTEFEKLSLESQLKMLKTEIDTKE